MTVSKDSPCKGRGDGKYAVRDVEWYMVCSGQKESYYKCGRGLIYQPSSTKCVSIKEVDPGKYYDNLYKVFLRSFLTCRKNLFQILVLSIAIKMELNAQADCATNFLQPMKLQENSSFF